LATSCEIGGVASLSDSSHNVVGGGGVARLEFWWSVVLVVMTHSSSESRAMTLKGWTEAKEKTNWENKTFYISESSTAEFTEAEFGRLVWAKR
jgi:hypothetical protein